jgi:hypothetical protein
MAAAPVMTQEGSGLDSGKVPPPNGRTFVNTERSVRVTTAVPSAAETQEIFDVALYKSNIQPVWVQVENLGDEVLWFLPVGLDGPISRRSRRRIGSRDASRF